MNISAFHLLDCLESYIQSIHWIVYY